MLGEIPMKIEAKAFSCLYLRTFPSRREPFSNLESISMLECMVSAKSRLYSPTYHDSEFRRRSPFYQEADPRVPFEDMIQYNVRESYIFADVSLFLEHGTSTIDDIGTSTVETREILNTS